MVIDEEDIKFKELLEEKRHKEVLAAINKMANAMSQNRNVDVVSAIEKNTQSLSSFVQAIKAIRPPEVNLNQDEVVRAMAKLDSSVTEQTKLLLDMKKDMGRKKDWEHKVNKNGNGNIESVTSKEI